MRLLKGKSCFIFKKIDANLAQSAEDALKVCFDHYKKKGWV